MNHNKNGGEAASSLEAVRLIRFPELQKLVGLSRTQIWRLERDGQFPARRYITKRAVAWPADEVFGWLESRTTRRAKSDQGAEQ